MNRVNDDTTSNGMPTATAMVQPTSGRQAALTAAFAQRIHESRYFIAGTLSGMSAIVADHPLDTVIVRLQTQQQSGVYKNAFDCFIKTVKNEGALALFNGLGARMSGAAWMGSLVFGTYGTSLKYLQQLSSPSSAASAATAAAIPTVTAIAHQQQQQSSSSSSSGGGGRFNFGDTARLIDIFNAGCVTGVVSSAFLCPFENVKVKMQLPPSALAAAAEAGGSAAAVAGLIPAGGFKNPTDCMRYIMRTRGVKGFYAGMYSLLIRDVPGYGVYFLAYEWLRRVMRKRNPETGEMENPSQLSLLIAGGIAGNLSWIVSYPADVVKSCMQAQITSSAQAAAAATTTTTTTTTTVTANQMANLTKPPTNMDIVRQILRTSGVRGLFVGLGATCVKSFPSNAIAFIVYQQVIDRL